MNGILLWAGMTEFSTVDYPGKPCAVVFLCGCPFHCPWCHSPELALADSKACDETRSDTIVDRLKQNFLISAVTITGGEPLMQLQLINLLRAIKTETKLLTKIDSNCFFPEQLEKALPLLDSISTDIKAPFNEKYGVAVGRQDWKNVVEQVKKSHEILQDYKVKNPNFLIEVRTTIVPDLIDNMKDIEQIARQVAYLNADIYTLQQFRPTKTLDSNYELKKIPSREEVLELAKIAITLLQKTKVRIVTEENGFEDVE